MVTMETALANVGGRGMNQLLDPAVMSLAELTSAGEFGAQDKIDLAIKLIGRVGLLRDKEYRRIITDSLKETQAMSLCNALGKDAGYAWDSLRDMRISKNSRAEMGMFDWFEIPHDEIPKDIEVEIPPTLVEIDAGHGLFRHQRDAIHEVRGYLDSKLPRAFLHMPTGSGKTRTAMNHICRILNEGEPRLIVWFAFNGELCEQAAGEFQKAWSFHGNREVDLQRMWGPHDVGDVTDDGILFVGLDKLWARVKRENTWLRNLADRVHLLIFDEAHQSTAETYQLMVETLLLNDECRLLGLSATPGRTYNDPVKDAELSDLYYRQKVSLHVEGYDSPLDHLVEEGYLSRPSFHEMTPPNEKLTDDDLERVSNLDDYDDKLLLKLSEDEWRNLLILDKLDDLIIRGHKRILVFCLSVKHSNMLAIFMNMKSNYRCASITSDTPPDKRAYWIESFVDDENDEPCVLFNYGVLTTGFDAPKTSAAIIARPTKSLLLYSQMVGRVIRGDRVGGTDEAEIWTVVDQKLPGFRDMSEAFWNWEDVW
jgi:superfamily II DNA or RNA helicase